MSVADELGQAVLANPGPVIQAGLSLIQTVVKMVQDAANAPAEKAEAIAAELAAAELQIKDAYDSLHAGLADELAADAEALRKAGGA